MTRSLCFLRSRSSVGRQSHANRPGRYMSNIFKKSASSWNVTYAQMATLWSPPRSFWSALMAASHALSAFFAFTASS